MTRRKFPPTFYGHPAASGASGAIQVQDSKLCGLKDDDSRVVPLGDSLLAVLREYRPVTGATATFGPAYAERDIMVATRSPRLSRQDPLAVDKFRKFLNDHVDKVFEDPGKASLPVLHHYGSLDAVEGILKSQRLWATHHKDTTDTNELTASESKVDKVAAELCASASGASRQVLKKFIEIYSKNRAADFVTVYLACFTTARDDRELWRRFSKDHGAAIAFRMLPGEVPPNDYEGSTLARGFGRVVYNQDILEEKIRTGFGQALSALGAELKRRAYAPAAADQLKYETWLQLTSIAATAAVMSKGTSYEVEAEWRWTAIADPTGKEPKPHVMPATPHRKEWRYLPLQFRADGEMFEIEEIMVFGPNPKDDETRVRKILTDTGYGGAKMPPIVISAHIERP